MKETALTVLSLFSLGQKNHAPEAFQIILQLSRETITVLIGMFVKES